MVFGSVRRTEWVMLLGPAAIAGLFWIVGLKWFVPDSNLLLFFSSMALLALSLLLALPLAVPAALLWLGAEVCWTVYCLAKPMTLTDMDLRAEKGMPYTRLYPHFAVLALLALTYFCRDALHIAEVVSGQGKL
jgi:hypothetical protein